MESFVAWVILPLALMGVAFGLGCLLRHVSGLPVPPGLLAPIGAAFGILPALAGYALRLGDVVTPLAVLVLALAGYVVALRGPGGLPRPGWSALVWAGAYGLYVAPVALSGHWTWTGYNFVNDTSIQLLLTEWIAEHGRRPPPVPFVSTPDDAIRSYLYGGYPLGSHALLAAMQGLVPIRLEALYQPYIAAWAGLAAMALTALVQRLVGARWAVFAAFAAVANNLLYHYALQGNMKEIVTAALLPVAAAVAAWSLTLLRESDPSVRGRILTRAAMLLAVPVAAIVDVLSTAGAPYAGLIVALWLALLLAYRLVPRSMALARALAAGAVVLLAGTAVVLSQLITFGRTTSATYVDPARATDLGHLMRPLEVRQTAGIWLIGDYRLPPAGAYATYTTIGVWLVLALAVVALVWLARRREANVLLLCVPVVAIMLAVTPRVSPYADAKTYMLMAPAVTLLGALGAAVAARLRAPLGWVLGAALLGGVMWSNAYAYHDVQLAPTDRMDALRDLDRRYAGRGLILLNEPEEFAKNFMRSTRLNVGAESVTPRQTQLRVPQAFGYLYFDLDELLLDYVEGFPYIALRRSPVTSRPPANYRLDHRNEYYEVWRRTPRPEVLEHLPLQGLDEVARRPRCAEVLDLAERARSGEMLIAGRAPTVVRLDTPNAPRTPTWRTHPFRAGKVLTGSPGDAADTVTFPETGRYRAWISGTFGRAVTGYVDERPIGSAEGVNTVGQWHEIGTVHVERGRHRLRLTRPGGSLAPGDGYAGELGPLALELVTEDKLLSVRPEDARSRLCGRKWDWIERVRP